MSDLGTQQSSLKALIAKGKEQNYLTFAEVNDHLPESISDPDQVEDIIQMIDDMGIKVYETAPDADQLLLIENETTDELAAAEAAAALAKENGVKGAFEKGLNDALTAAGYPLVADKNTTVAKAANFIDIFTAQKLTIIAILTYLIILVTMVYGPIAAMLVELFSEHGAGTLIFQDDHFMADKERVRQILAILRELELNSIYQSGLALYALDRPMLEEFFAAGVRQLVLAVESGSQRVLKQLMKKPLKLEISQRVAQDCRELGIYTNTNILIGIPGETKEDIEETRRNLRTINSNWFHINCTSPLVGSEIHSKSRQLGFIRGETLGADYKVAAIETPDFSTSYIQEMQYVMNLELNFVHNNDVRLGEYALALRGFENVIKIKSDHAFAWHFASICHERLGHESKATECAERYLEYSQTPFWQKYVDMFNLPQ